jgi:O-succinylbenzoate synthase
MGARVYRYRVPWRRSSELREGLFVRTDDGFAECSPLPGLHPRPLSAYADVLVRWARGEAEHLPYAARFAISSVSFAAVDREVAVAGLVLRGDDPAHLPRGLEAVKVKVGGDLSAVARVRDCFPDAELRVDVNRGWTLQDAERAWAVLEPLGVSYVEEPLREPSGLPALPFPIALDETLREQPELVSAPWLAVAVFKPELAELRVGEARRSIVSACFPTDLGLWALGVLADRAGLAGAQGLGTLRFLDTSDLYETPLEQTARGFSLAVRPVPRWSALEELT